MGILFVVAFLALGVVYLGAGYAGIEAEFGFWWGVASVACAMLLRFTIPLSVGVYLYCAHVLGWHWAVALLCAAPGVALMLPGLIAAGIEGIRGLMRPAQ